jgi:hypothetical protein
MEINNDEIKIKISIIKASVWTLIAFGVLSILIWAYFKIWILPSGFNKSFLLTGITLLTSAAGFACISGLAKLFNRNYGLIINNLGIHINIGPNHGQLVKWEEIKGLKVHCPFRGPMTLLIFLKNPDKIFTELSGFKRFILKMNNVSHKTPVSLTSNWLSCSFGELVTIIKDKYKKNSA